MFNNGYNNFYPYQTLNAKQGLFSMFKGKFNWSTILNNTQKTLNIINQAIPVFYQIKPIWDNTKTVFKIMGALKDDDKKQNYTSSYKKQTLKKEDTLYQNNTYSNDNTPNFFL